LEVQIAICAFPDHAFLIKTSRGAGLDEDGSVEGMKNKKDGMNLNRDVPDSLSIGFDYNKVSKISRILI
jgi:hypothetical protein